MHSPGYLREAFVEWAESQPPRPDEIGEDIFFDGEPRPIRWMIGQLWNCSDIMPSHACESLGLPRGSTYGQAAQSLLV